MCAINVCVCVCVVRSNTMSRLAPDGKEKTWVISWNWNVVWMVVSYAAISEDWLGVPSSQIGLAIWGLLFFLYGRGQMDTALASAQRITVCVFGIIAMWLNLNLFVFWLTRTLGRSSTKVTTEYGIGN